MTPPRSDYRPEPVRGKYGLPGNRIPQVNPADLIIVENVPIRDSNYKPLAPGTPHPRYPLAVLVSEQQGKSNGAEQSVNRIYATRLTAQEALNARHKYEAELNGFPTFIRTYIMPMVDYEIGGFPGTKLQPLDSIIRIVVDNPGSGYSASPEVALSAPPNGFTCVPADVGGTPPDPTQNAIIAFTAVSLGTFTGTAYLAIDASSSPANAFLSADPQQLFELGECVADGSGNLVFTGPNPAFTVSGYKAGVLSLYAITPSQQATATAEVLYGVDGPANRTVSAIWVTNSGSGYINTLDGSQNATVTIAAPSSGVTATARVVMQPSGAVLVAEETGPIDEPELMDLAPYYIKVTQTFQTIPGPILKDFTYNERGEEVTTITQTVSAVASVDADGLLVEKADLNVTGPTATRTFATVTSRVTLEEKQLGNLALFPDKFRFSIEVDKASTIVDPSTSPTTLTSTLIESVISPHSATKSERVDTSLANTTWPVFTGKEVSVQTWGAKASVVETMVADGTAPSTGLQLISSDVSTLGNGWSLKRDLVFQNPNAWPSLTSKQLGYERAIPGKWRAALEFDATKSKVTPGTSPTPLGSGVVISTMTPETVDRSEAEVTTIIGDPPTLTGHEYSVQTWGQSGSVVEDFVVDGTAPDTGINVISSTVDTLGNGYSERRTIVLSSGWGTLSEKQLGAIQAIPEKFRLSQGTVTVRSKVASSASPDALSGGVIESVIIPETKDRSEKRTTSITGGTFPTLPSYIVDQQTWGTVGAISESIVTTGSGDTPATGIGILDSHSTALGNGSSVLSTTTVTWPAGGLSEKKLGGLGLIPPKFLAGIVTVEVRKKVDPTTDPTALSATVVESGIIPETVDRSESRTTTVPSPAGFVELDGTEVSRETLGQVADVVETIVVTGSGDDVPDTGLNILASTTTPLGNGYTLKRTVDNVATGWPSLTDKALGGINLIPEKFRGALTISTVKSKVAPSTSPTALSSTVIESRVISETKDRSELQVASLSSGTLPTLTGYEVGSGTWGAIASVAESIVTTGSGDTPATGIGILESRATTLGNGKSLLSTTSLTWPSGGLTEKRLGGIDALPGKFRIGAEFDTVRKKVAPSTTPTALSSTVLQSEVIPETVDRSELRDTSVSGSLPSFTDHQLNARGEVVAVAESIVATGTAVPSATFHTTAIQQNSLGNGQDLLRVESVASFAALTDYQESGGSVLRQTTISRSDAASGIPGSYPDTGAHTISDTLEQDNLQQIVRRLVKLTDTGGGALTSNPVVTVPLEYDKRTNVQIFRDYQLVAATATLPAIGAVYPTSSSTYVIDARISPLGEAPYFGVNAIQEVEYCAIPAPWVEFPMVGFEFPALFKFSNNYSINSIAAFYSGFPPPWPGDGTTLGTYQLVAHRQAVRQARRVHTYSPGPSNATPVAYKVITPGVSSNFFRIPPNCIHAAINITGTSTVGPVTTTYPIETIPASNPSAYLTTQILVHSCEERRIFGNIYERITTEISEDTPPSQFGPVGAAVSFVSTVVSHPIIDAQPDAAGETLWLKSSSGSDTQTCIVYGRRGATVIRERIALSGTNFVQTTHRFQRLYHLHVGSAPAGDVKIYGSGIPAAGLLDFSLATIADGDTVEVGITGSTQIYRFKTTMALANDIQLAGDIPTSIQNLALAVSLTGLAGTTAAAANYFTGTAATANIIATIDDGDPTVIHFADTTALQTNSNTYVLTPTFAGTAPTVTVFGGSANGPVLATITHTSGLKDAYQVEYLNNPGLLTDIEAPAVAGVSQSVVSASSDGSSTIVNNLPATVLLTSDGLAVPPSASAYSLIMCLAGTPSITPTYETSADNVTWTSGTTGLPALGNGKVFTVEIAEASPKWIRVKIDNTGSNLARAVHVALAYEVPT